MLTVEITEKDRRQLARTYQMVTSNIVTDKLTTEQAMMELFVLKSQLRSEARLYGLDGIFVEIHSSLVVEELDNFTVSELLLYVDMMHYKINPAIREQNTHAEIAMYLQILLWKRLEMFRLHKYKISMLMEPIQNRVMTFPGILSWTTTPSGFDIQAFGIEYFYPQIGTLSTEILLEKFDFRELLHVAILLSNLRLDYLRTKGYKHNDLLHERIIISTNVRSADLANMIIFYTRDLGLDPRGYITPLGFVALMDTYPVSIGNEITLTDDVIFEACSLESISIKFPSIGIYNLDPKHEISDLDNTKPIEMLWEEYTIAQLTPNFTLDVGVHRNILDALINKEFSDGTPVTDYTYGEDNDSLIFFGKRDGVGGLFVYTLKELHDTFENCNGFYEPHSVRKNPENPALWTKFPIRCIKYLLEHILFKRSKVYYNKELTRIIRKLLNATEVNDVAFITQHRYLQQLIANKNDVLDAALLRLYNIGTLFENYYEEIDFYDESLLVQQMLDNVSMIAPPADYTGRVNAKARDLIIRAQTAIIDLEETAEIFRRLGLIKVWNAQPHLILDDETYTIGGYLNVMHDLAKFNLSKTLIECGKTLRITANVYMKEIFNKNIGDYILNIYETSAIYEKLTNKEPVDDLD